MPYFLHSGAPVFLGLYSFRPPARSCLDYCFIYWSLFFLSSRFLSPSRESLFIFGSWYIVHLPVFCLISSFLFMRTAHLLGSRRCLRWVLLYCSLLPLSTPAAAAVYQLPFRLIRHPCYDSQKTTYSTQCWNPHQQHVCVCACMCV